MSIIVEIIGTTISPWAVPTIRGVCTAIMGLAVLSLCTAILIDFRRFDHRKGQKGEKKSLVATGTMFAFFGLYYIALLLKPLAFPIHNITMIIGTIMVVAGVVINILARFQLGSNWANHIKIYSNHKLITTGFYSISRHPLYTSLFLSLFGGALAYSSWLAAALTAFVFIPMMNYRAKQEEELLAKEFPEYKKYIKKVRRFI